MIYGLLDTLVVVMIIFLASLGCFVSQKCNTDSLPLDNANRHGFLQLIGGQT